jgi:hypothetical protein
VAHFLDQIFPRFDELVAQRHHTLTCGEHRFDECLCGARPFAGHRSDPQVNLAPLADRLWHYSACVLM